MCGSQKNEKMLISTGITQAMTPKELRTKKSRGQE